MADETTPSPPSAPGPPPGPAADVVLEAQDVRKHYGGLYAVDGVNLQIRQGSFTAIIGPNGAGKSTLFNVLAGSEAATSGRILLFGKEIGGVPTHRRARLGLVRTFQQARPLSRMTVLENLLLAPTPQAGERWWMPLVAFPRVASEERALRAKAEEALGFFELSALRDEYAGALSGGQKKLLARALMTEPKVMLLDEPLAGVNPTLARKILDKVETLRRDRGITFVLVEHDLETVFTRCEPILVMANGRLLAHGSAAEIRANREVVAAYLGG